MCFIKKLFVIISLLTLLVNVAFANCRPDYQTDIKILEKKYKTVRTVGRVTTSTVGGISGLFFGTMGVLLLGPLWAGALIGAQFALVAALPVGTPFFIYNLVRKSHLKGLKEMDEILGSLELEESTSKSLKKLIKRVQKKRQDVSESEIITQLKELNENRLLCNGEISRNGRKPKNLKNTATLKEVSKYLIKSL